MSPVADLTPSQTSRIYRVRLFLAERGTSFNAWCLKHGFSDSTARLAIAGEHHGVRSALILRRLRKDFPKLEI